MNGRINMLELKQLLEILDIDILGEFEAFYDYNSETDELTYLNKDCSICESFLSDNITILRDAHNMQSIVGIRIRSIKRIMGV